MTRWRLAALTIPALATLAIVAPPTAQAQTWLEESPPAVRSVANELRRLCRARGRTPIVSADFLFSVDADRDGEDDDILLTEAGFSCLTRAQLAGAEGGHGGSGMQWLLVKGRGPLRLVWRGRTPSLYLSGEDGLVGNGGRCDPGRCARYVWNGQGLVRMRGGGGGR
jgi:hypothetical protein